MIKGGGRCFFLSRPRRFGKSLLVSTLHEALAGNRDLFDNLWIGSSDYQWQPHGIINLDLSALDISSVEVLPNGLFDRLAEIAAHYQLDINFERVTPGLDLRKLVLALHKHFGRVAILIDEYNSPVLRHLHDQTEAKAIRNALHGFFSVIKGLGDYVNFLFITGISAFSKAGIFSGMNDLRIISLQESYADICGYTDVEIDAYFRDYITAWADAGNHSYAQQRELIKQWYNGYRFSEAHTTVYSPFSVMHALEKQKLQNFWFSSATPTFLVEELKKQQREQPGAFEDILENRPMKMDEESLSSFEIGLTPLPLLMFQTGYLTITDYQNAFGRYQLGYPNREVEQSLQLNLLSIVTKLNSISTKNLAFELSEALVKKDVATALQIVRKIFASMPYHIHGEDEKHYHAILYMVLKIAGVAAQAEVATSHGRADIIINLPHVVYVIEVKFKDDATKANDAAKALAQIEERRYYEQFLNSKKDIVLLGISFKRGDSAFEINYDFKTICE